MKDYILQHRAERDRLLGIEYLPREGLAEAAKWLETEMVKVIVGPRRAGKSVFGLSLLKGKNFAYVNFEDEALGAVLRPGNYDDLMRTVDEVYPDSKYVFFDEVQNLPQWEVFLNKLHRRGRNLVVTGSNANMLGQEMATALTGRVVELKVLPFSYGEYLLARPAGSLGEFLRLGGYPEVVVKGLDGQAYVRGLMDAILAKDVARRFNINRPQLLFDLNDYLLTQFGYEISYSRLAAIFGLSSANTIAKYMWCLQAPYLYFLLERYNFKPKLRKTAPRKLYLVDTGFAPLGFSADVGRLLENAVFLQLVRQGWGVNDALFSYKTRNQKEVDFALKEGVRVRELVQVCADLTSAKTLVREVSGLTEAGEELNCDQKTIVTVTKPGGVKAAGVKIILASEWLRQSR